MKLKTLLTLEGLDEEVGIAYSAITRKQSVTLFGAPGRGKTHMAIGLMQEWVKHKTWERPMNGLQGHKATFLPAPEFFFEIKQTYNSATGKDEETVMASYSWVDLLVIDDLGAEKVTDWSRQLLYLLIDRRYRNGRQTIITTNLTPSQLAETIDARIVSRLAEMGVVIELKGSDKRLSVTSEVTHTAALSTGGQVKP